VSWTFFPVVLEGSEGGIELLGAGTEWLWIQAGGDRAR